MSAPQAECEAGGYATSSVRVFTKISAQQSSTTRPLALAMPKLPRTPRVGSIAMALPLAMVASAAELGAQSDRWVEVAAGSNVTVYVDRVSLRTQGNRVRVWTKWRFSSEQEVMPYSEKKYRSEKNLDLYNCTNRTSATIQRTLYADAEVGGEVVDSRSIPEALARFTELAPETLGEAILTFACERSPKKRR